MSKMFEYFILMNDVYYYRNQVSYLGTQLLYISVSSQQAKNSIACINRHNMLVIY
jgi:hypothetical protein